jgi:hypothetical protein
LRVEVYFPELLLLPLLLVQLVVVLLIPLMALPGGSEQSFLCSGSWLLF